MHDQPIVERPAHSPVTRTLRWTAFGFAAAAMALIGFGSPLRAVDAAQSVKDTPGVGGTLVKYPEGAKTYDSNCAACHETGAGRAPLKIILSNLTPGMIYDSLKSGVMAGMGAALSEDQKVQVSQYLTGQAMGAPQPAVAAAKCAPERATFDRMQPPVITGWGLDDAGTHFLPSSTAGIGKADLGKLKLKWAFGFPQSSRTRSQPAIGAGAIFIGAHAGQVYALDRKTGCVRWQFDAGAEVRTAIILEPWQAGDTKAAPMLFFGDWKGNAYALNAFTGKLVWKIPANDHPATVITAAPVLYGDTLYVGVSSLEEASAATPGYQCCTFRGSVLALDAKTGIEKWRTWLVNIPTMQPGGKSLGPSGVPVWAGMAVDAKRGNLLIATGDNYTQPATDLSDAIVALDLKTGTIKWHHQVLAGDAWNVDCITPDPDQCPEDAGPDYDFGAGPALTKGKDGKDYVIAANKSGSAYGIDPDTGAKVWETKLGRGGMIGGTHFGLAAGDGRAYIPISDQPEPNPAHPTGKPGMNALDVATGKLLWHSPAPMVCTGRQLCMAGYSGTVSVTPDMLIAGSDDGFLRIYDPVTGAVIWEYDTARDFETVNGVAARGGGMSGGAGAIAIDGQLIVPSGYGFVSKMPGNVLLVFEPE